MKKDFNIRKNDNGDDCITIHANHFDEGMSFVNDNRISDVQISNALGLGALGIDESTVEIDFKKFEKNADLIKKLSLKLVKLKIVNFDSIYTLENLEWLGLEKQKFSLDVSRFPKLKHLGAEYWKGLLNIGTAKSLESVVIIKFPKAELSHFSGLDRLNVLHVYSSKIQSLDGIQNLPIEKIMLARNNQLTDISALSQLSLLKNVWIEKCKNITADEVARVVDKHVEIRIL
jgi:internalin A